MLRELHANAGFGVQVDLPPPLIFFFFRQTVVYLIFSFLPTYADGGD